MTILKTTENNLPKAKPKAMPRPGFKALPPAAPPALQAEIWKRVNTASLYPPFFAKLELLLAACEARGARYYATSGLRSWDDQAALYAQGRSKPGKIVTNAKPGQSAHNFAVAADFCRDSNLARDGLQPDWDIEAYRILAEEAVKLGLEAAFNWTSFKEGPHIQLPLKSQDISLADLAGLYANNGASGVFNLLNRYRW